MSILVVAEKPSVAGSIAAFLGASTRKNGYFEGNGYVVSWAFGHLFGLCDAPDYNPKLKKWTLSDYPFIPAEFQYKVNKGAADQVKILKELWRTTDEVVNACDADREGELIFCEIKNAMPGGKKVRRLWVSSHTEKDLKAGFSNLKNELTSLEDAGYSRQQMDWMIGINFTVLFTKASSAKNVVKVGRVILPTLKLIYDRDSLIANFVAKSFYGLTATFTGFGIQYSGNYIDANENMRFDDRAVVDALSGSLTGASAKVTELERNEVKEGPPTLFNLLDLQGRMSQSYDGWSPDKVLKVCQSLYEKKFLTYPRTESRYLDDSLKETAKEVLDALKTLPFHEGLITTFHTGKSVFDSSKVDSHPAIMPTYMIPDLARLDKDERDLYIEVAKRFVAHFMPAAVWDKLKAVTTVFNRRFKTTGRTLISPGWKVLYIGEQEEKETEDDVSTLPPISMGLETVVNNAQVTSGKTKPESPYTEATLLKSMESCGNKVQDANQIMKGYSLGTAATRAETIKKLLDCGYVDKKKKQLRITEYGIWVIEHFPAEELLAPEMTGRIEKALKDIENGEMPAAHFMQRMRKFVQDYGEILKGNGVTVYETIQESLGPCPSCGSPVVEFQKSFSCSKAKEKQCDFILWKDSKFLSTMKKKLTVTIAKSLISKGRAKVKNFESKAGKKFDADLVLTHKDGRYSYELEFNSGQKKG